MSKNNSPKKTGVVLFQLGGPDSLDVHRAISLQPVLRSRYHRFPVRQARAKAAGEADLDQPRQARGASLRRDRRQIAHSRFHAPAGGGARAGVAARPGREGDHRDAVLASDDGRRHRRDGGVRAGRACAAAALSAVFEDHHRQQRERMEPLLSAERLASERPADRDVL